MSDELTHEERMQLAKYIEGLSSEELKALPIVKVEDFDSPLTLSEEASRRILTNILHPQHLSGHKHPAQHLYFWIASIAASLLLAVAAGFYFYHSNITSKMSRTIVAKAITVPPTTATSFTRQITLNDGTTVVLKAGSKLSIDKGFMKKTREVSLSGEAYFDVKHRNNKPFIIHTGKVNTTVLGTAFVIKSDARGVEVSVTRGTVRVERGKQVLAILGVDDRVKCSIACTDIIIERNKSEETASSLNWAKQGLSFDHVSMLSVVRQLSQRYGVNITIPNQEIANTPLYISFEGTESISDLMNVICSMLPNMSYQKDGNNIVITQK